MEAPIRVQAPHHPQLFRGHSYPNNTYSSHDRDSRDSNMSYQRPYQHDGGRYEAHFQSDSGATVAPTRSTFERQDIYGDFGGRPPILHPPHAVDSHISRFPPGGFVENNSNSRLNQNHSQPTIPYYSQPPSAPMSPQRTQLPAPQEGCALPGVGVLLASIARPDDGRPFSESEARHPPNDLERRHYGSPVGRHPPRERFGMRPGPLHQPRGNGHSTGSSWSSTHSADSSSIYPHQGYAPPYSPTRPPHEYEFHGRSTNYQLSRRDEQPLHYGPAHHRSQTLPAHSLPVLPPHTNNATGPGFADYPAAHRLPDVMHSANDPTRGSFATQQYLPNDFPGYDRARYDSHFPPSEAFSNSYNSYYPQHGSSLARKRRGNLPKEATKAFKEWFQEHKDSPYPSEDEKQRLCDMTKLNMSQVNNWFINARRRLPRQDAKQRVERGASGDARASTEASEESTSTDYQEVSGSTTGSVSTVRPLRDENGV